MLKRFVKCAMACYTDIVKGSYPIIVTGESFSKCLERANELHIPYDYDAVIWGYIMSDSSFVTLDDAGQYADMLGIEHCEKWVEDYEVWPELIDEEWF